MCRDKEGHWRGDIGDTRKTGTGMSGIFQATSRDAEGHLGGHVVREGHIGATQGNMLEKYQATRKDTVEHMNGTRRDTREDTGHQGEKGEHWAQVRSSAIPQCQVLLLPLLPLCSPPGALGTPAQPLHVNGEGVTNNRLSPCFGRHTQLLVRGQSRDRVAISQPFPAG